jgi:hypothetical protein
MEIQLIKRKAKVIEEVVKETINLEYPTEHKFYKTVDNGAFFARGLILFAILIKHRNSFLLFEITKGKQYYTDFVPSKDCRQDYWLTDTNDIRRNALDIMMNKSTVYEEISKEEFFKERDNLLNEHFTDAVLAHKI